MTPKMEDKDFYTAEEIAEVLQISKMTVYRMMDKGDLPYHQIGKVKRVSRADWEEYQTKTRRAGHGGK